ncbi:MAG: DUF502 domain-containing protein [Acidobacteria bacterium]|nr:DUF502 domain-containing protein [Acidobacteriota bacterium]
MRIWQRIRARFLGGFLVLLPLFVTLWVLLFLFRLIDRTITPWVVGLLAWLRLPVPVEAWIRPLAPVLALVLTAAVICLFGVLAGDVFGRSLLRGIDSLFLRVPLIKFVYGSSRQIMDAFTASGSQAFQKVVLVEYPRRGMYAIGFATGEGIRFLHTGNGAELVTVFLPTTPNPTSGMMVALPPGEVQALPLTVEEGMKMIISGGLVVPKR